MIIKICTDSIMSIIQNHTTPKILFLKKSSISVLQNLIHEREKCRNSKWRKMHIQLVLFAYFVLINYFFHE